MNKGILYGIAAYAIWGFFPIYWKLLEVVPAVQIVANRLVWSLLFLLLIVSMRRDWAGMRKAFNRPNLLVSAAAGVLLSVNWLVYIWGVNSGFVIETSLGYFINPLVNVLLGVVFLRERLTLSKWVPVGLAALGVLYLTINYGSLPWISLTLAFSFGLYGLIKKVSPLGSLHGLTLETAILFLPSFGYLVFIERQGSGALGHTGIGIMILLFLTGILTAVPLLLFASAARSIKLSTLGLLQYIAPTLQFLLGVLAFHEPFTAERLIGFAMIWIALIILTLGGFYERHRAFSAA